MLNIKNVTIDDLQDFENLHNILNGYKPGDHIEIPGGPNTALDPKCAIEKGKTRATVIKVIDSDQVTILFENGKNVSGDAEEYFDYLMDTDEEDLAPDTRGSIQESLPNYFKKQNRDVKAYVFDTVKAFRVQYWTQDWELKVAEVDSSFFIQLPPNVKKHL